MSGLENTAFMKVECHIGIDPGDRSVGIPEGWDEDTMVTVTHTTYDGTYITGACFEPEMDEPCAKWRVTQVWTNFRDRHAESGQLSTTYVTVVDVEKPTIWRRGQTRPVAQQVMDLPRPMQRAIQGEWNRFKLILEQEAEADRAMADAAEEALEEGGPF